MQDLTLNYVRLDVDDDIHDWSASIGTNTVSDDNASISVTDGLISLGASYSTILANVNWGVPVISSSNTIT